MDGVRRKVSTGNDEDVEALRSLHDATHGSYWDILWDLTADPKTWHGVKMNSDGRVISLDLSNNNLRGYIPKEIGLLPMLNSLVLGENQLTGPLPKEIGLLTNIFYLHLHSNKLTGSIPKELKLLKNMEGLNLSDNQLTGPVPKEIGMLTNLFYLQLDANKLTGSIPKELGLLKNLEGLYLSGNQLTGPLPKEIGLLTNIFYLQLDANKLTGPIPEEVRLLTKLHCLDLGGNQLTGSIPKEIGLLTKLEFLFLHSNKLNGLIPEELALLTSVQELDLSGNRLTGPVPEELNLLTNLQELDLGGNRLTGSIPKDLRCLTNQRQLSMRENQLTGEISGDEYEGDIPEDVEMRGTANTANCFPRLVNIMVGDNFRGRLMEPEEESAPCERHASAVGAKQRLWLEIREAFVDPSTQVDFIVSLHVQLEGLTPGVCYQPNISAQTLFDMWNDVREKWITCTAKNLKPGNETPFWNSCQGDTDVLYLHESGLKYGKLLEFAKGLRPDNLDEGARLEGSAASSSTCGKSVDGNTSSVQKAVAKNIEAPVLAHGTNSLLRDLVTIPSGELDSTIRQEFDGSSEGGSGAIPSGFSSDYVVLSRNRAQAALDRDRFCAVQAKEEAYIKTMEARDKCREEYKKLRNDLSQEREATEPDSAFIAILEKQLADTLKHLDS